MGGKSNPGVSSTVSAGEQGLIGAATSAANTAEAQSTQLFNQGEQAATASNNFYQTLASGDPYAIARAIAPATQQIGQASAGAKENIIANAPAGGEKNLALEQVDVNQGAQVGQTASQGYLGAFNALGQQGAQGLSLAQGAAGTGISGLNTGLSGYSTQGQQQLAGQELQLQQKGQTLGAIGGLAGDAATLGGAGMTAGATKGLTAALAA